MSALADGGSTAASLLPWWWCPLSTQSGIGAFMTAPPELTALLAKQVEPAADDVSARFEPGLACPAYASSREAPEAQG